jgi:hypothetical protein
MIPRTTLVMCGSLEPIRDCLPGISGLNCHHYHGREIPTSMGEYWGAPLSSAGYIR